MKYFIYAVIAVVAIAIVAGFFVVGSPQEERLRRFDEQKIQNLQIIQSHIGEFYRAKRRLPQRLEELNDAFRGISIPNDPQTGQDYGYEARGSLNFALCAAFNRPSREQQSSLAPKAVPLDGGPFGREVWEHGTGNQCFERTIDEDFFQPISEKIHP